MTNILRHSIILTVAVVYTVLVGTFTFELARNWRIDYINEESSNEERKAEATISQKAICGEVASTTNSVSKRQPTGN